MSYQFIKNIFGAAFLVAGLAGCVKNIEDTQAIQDDFSNNTTVQFINASVSSTRNSVYVDGVPVNYATIAYGGQFPASPSPGFLVAPGLRAFQVRDTLATSNQPRLSFAENFQTNSYYTIFLYDTVTAVKQKTVFTNIQIPSDTTARVRFANFIFSSVAVPAVDVFSVKRNANVFTNINTNDVTEFIPYATGVNDTLIVRSTGTTNALAQLNGFNPARKRSYTLVFRGRYQTTGTATIARTLVSYISY